jgi:hypothetical protein
MGVGEWEGVHTLDRFASTRMGNIRMSMFMSMKKAHEHETKRVESAEDKNRDTTYTIDSTLVFPSKHVYIRVPTH